MAAQEPEYRAIFEASSDGLVITDAETGVVVEANPAFCRMHGYDRMVGLHPTSFIHPASHPLFADYVRTLQAGGEYRGRAQDVRCDGSVFDVEVLGRGFTYQGRFAMLGVVRDVTEQVHAYQVLEQRVAERTREARERTREAEQRLRELEVLYDADQLLHGSLRLDRVLQALVDVAADILHSDKSMVLVWDSEHVRLVPGATRGFRPETVARLAHVPGEGITGLVAQRREPIAVPDTWHDPRVRRAFTDPEGIRALIHAPIIVDGAFFGVFGAFYSAPHQFSGDEERILLSLAQRAALAIQNARLFEQAQQAATLEERQRLARELHDAVTQTLFSTALIADIIPDLWDLDPAEARQRLEELRRLTRGALAEMRTLLVELRPGALTELPLEELLRQLGEAAAGRSRLEVAVEADGPRQDRLPAEVQVNLYRIAQEALNNIARHAQARHASLRLDRAVDGAVRLWIKDDGRGFDPAAVPAGHLGMVIMRERAQATGAALRVDSAPGIGTQIEVSWRPRQGSVR